MGYVRPHQHQRMSTRTGSLDSIRFDLTMGRLCVYSWFGFSNFLAGEMEMEID